MKFSYCDKNLVNIDFEADDSLNEDEIFELWDMVDVDTKNVPVFEVNVEQDDDEYLMYIFIENGDVDYMSDATFKLCETLKGRDFDAMVSDEDYGGTDVIIVTFTSEHLQIARQNIYERSLRVCPECGERKAHMVAGQTAGGREIHQFYCPECNYGWIGHPNGEFIREGVLYSSWDVR